MTIRLLDFDQAPYIKANAPHGGNVTEHKPGCLEGVNSYKISLLRQIFPSENKMSKTAGFLAK
jgi:hypothetical protein